MLRSKALPNATCHHLWPKSHCWKKKRVVAELTGKLEGLKGTSLEKITFISNTSEKDVCFRKFASCAPSVEVAGYRNSTSRDGWVSICPNAKSSLAAWWKGLKHRNWNPSNMIWAASKCLRCHRRPWLFSKRNDAAHTGEEVGKHRHPSWEAFLVQSNLTGLAWFQGETNRLTSSSYSHAAPSSARGT